LLEETLTGSNPCALYEKPLSSHNTLQSPPV